MNPLCAAGDHGRLAALQLPAYTMIMRCLVSFACLLLLMVLPGRAEEVLQVETMPVRSASTFFVSSNIHLLHDGKGQGILIDTGFSDSAPTVMDFLRRNGVFPSGLKAVVVTHFHEDHAGGAAALYDRLLAEGHDVPFYAGNRELGFLAGIRADRLCSTSALLRFVTPKKARLKPAFQAAIPVAGSVKLELSGHEITLVEIGSHTPGSLIAVAGTHAFLGDLVRGKMWRQQQATVHFTNCDLRQNRQILDEVLNFHAPAATIFYPGHYGPLNRASLSALVADAPVWE